MISTKTRIYDLAQACTYNEADQKARKVKQTEITKQIISICETMGLQVKSGQSSVEENHIDKIIGKLQEQGLGLSMDIITNELKKHLTEKKSKTQAKELPPLEPPQPVKKQIKIVRRIKPPPPPGTEQKEETTGIEVKPLTQETIIPEGPEKREIYPVPSPKKEETTVVQSTTQVKG